MSSKLYRFRLGSINYQPLERYLYVDVNDQWLLVREKGAKFITQKKYDEMCKQGMPNIFERVR